MNVDDIECDESIVVFNITKEIDSINFKNAIIQFQLPFELPEFEKELDKMIIEKEFGNDYYGNLVIQDYPNLQSVVVKKNSLKNLNSLKICNCEKLNIIEIEGSSLNNTKIFELMSIILYHFGTRSSVIISIDDRQYQ